ncbi:MAG: hypothetical protein PSV18_05335 [Methylobacter sp.]|nr:hypothetical protein [Candidatus Methylobacter titanis]
MITYKATNIDIPIATYKKFELLKKPLESLVKKSLNANIQTRMSH